MARIVALVGPGDPGLLGSYVRAYQALGHQVICWDPYRGLQRHVRFGRIGRFAATMVSVDPWVSKASRDMMLAAVEHAPDVLLASGNPPLRPGALSQLRLMLPSVRLVLLWPDTLLNLGRNTLEALPVYDVVATYSQASIAELKRLGAQRAEWLPFGADTLLFPSEVALDEADRREYGCDVCLVGNHRPERESAIISLIDAGIDVKVWGSLDWRKLAADKAKLRSYFQGRPLFGMEFAKAIRAAGLSLNPIDPTNFPAANMRFFESPACGGASLNSACPEMASIFRDRVHAFYYDSPRSLPGLVRELLSDRELRQSIATAGKELALSGHTYVHRAKQLLEQLQVS